MSQTTQNLKTMTTDNMTRDEFTELFVDVLKICKPEHPYYTVVDPYDIITPDRIKTTFCRSDSNYYARCGPRSDPYVALYAIDLDFFQSSSFEQVLAITTHEATHIPIGSHNGRKSPAHPPKFWNEMAFHAQLVIDNLDELEDKWGHINEEEFKYQIINDPNSSMVDGRSETVYEVKSRLCDWVVDYSSA